MEQEQQQRRQAARARWALLRAALLGGGVTPGPTSKRAFPGFSLFATAEAPSGDAGGGEREPYAFVQYTALHAPPEAAARHGGAVRVVLRQRQAGASLARPDLAGFDNTGNIRVWPAEEVLAHYCLQHPELFRGKRVCEIGAGLGLAGVVVACHLDCACVLITDGNDKAAASLRASVERNGNVMACPSVRAEKLLWDRHAPVPDHHRHRFDVVIAADCLFLHEYHEDLLHTADGLLEPEGQVLILAPQRGPTLGTFVKKAAEREWQTELVEEYDPCVWERHRAFSAGPSGTSWTTNKQDLVPLCYDPDVHYPLLLRMWRPTRGCRLRRNATSLT